MRFPATLELTAFAMLIAILVGVPVGVISAVRQYSLLDKAASVFALTGISMPIFWLAMILIVIFGVNLELLPFPGRLGPTTAITSITGLVLVDSLLDPQLRRFLGRAFAPHHASHRPRHHTHGRDHADDALQHARGDGRGLREDGAGQGRRPVAGGLQAFLEERHAAHGHRHRAAGGALDGGFDPHGDHLLLAWGGPDHPTSPSAAATTP